MKVPLRFQVTEFDCGTVSLLNAFSYLFERDEIPAELVKAIHRYTLDCYDEYGNIGQGGTSREAINKLTHWITRYANSHDFKVVCERLEGNAVTLDKMVSCCQKILPITFSCLFGLFLIALIVVCSLPRGNKYVFKSSTPNITVPN